MMRVAGFIAVLLVGGVPVVMLPDVRMLEAGAVVWAMCGVALLLRSLGLAVLGSIVGVMLFCASLLLGFSGAIVEAVLMGIAILTLLDATYFEQRFRTAVTKQHVAAHQLVAMAVFVLAGVVGAVTVVLLAPVLSQDLDATLRSFVVAFGIVLVLGAMVWKASV